MRLPIVYNDIGTIRVSPASMFAYASIHQRDLMIQFRIHYNFKHKSNNKWHIKTLSVKEYE